MINKIMFQTGPNGSVPNWRQFVKDMAAKSLPVFAAVTDTRSLVDDILEFGATGSRVNWRPTEGPLPDEMREFAPEWQDDWGVGDENRYKINNPDYNNYTSNKEAHDTYKRGAVYHIKATLLRAKQVGVPINHPFITIKTWNEIRNPDESNNEAVPPGFSDWHDVAGWQAYYIGKELVRRKAIGEPWFRWSAFGFAGDNPHDGAWEAEGMMKFLRLCAEYPDVLGICLHEYSFTFDIWRDFDQRRFIGRFEKLFAVCDKWGIKRPWIEIAEWGWKEDDIPEQKIALKHIREVSAYYSQFPEIKLAAIWTANGGWRGASDKVPNLASGVYEFSLQGKAVELPPNSPEPSDKNLLVNGSFEDGWTQADPTSGNQRPNGWNVEWVSAGNRLRNGQIATREPEIVIKLASQLPPHEQAGGASPLILEGTAVLKMFVAHGRCGALFSQTVSGLKPNQAYHFEGSVQVHYQNELNEPHDVSVHLYANGSTGEWDAVDLPNREWKLLGIQGKADENGQLNVYFYAENFYENSRDWFFESFRVYEAVKPPETPPNDVPARKVVVNLLPTNATLTQSNTVLQAAYPKRQPLVFIAEDAAALIAAGSEDSEVIEWNFDDKPAGNPLVGLKLGPLLGVPFQVTSRFNDPRSYGNGLHEGVDLDELAQSADSKTPILCPYDGVVTRARKTNSRGEPSAYGWHYIIKSENNGGTFFQWIAHCDELFFEVGDTVKKGDPIAELGGYGETGKGRFAEHVHYNLQVPGYGLKGYVVSDVVDPLPYFNNEQPIKYYAHTTARNGLRLRSGSSSSSQILAIMPFNSRVAVYDDSSHWWKIRYNNTAGFAWHTYLRKEELNTIDLLPYLRGDDKRHYELKYTWDGGGTHPTQSQHGGDGVFFIVKGHSGEYEMLYVDDDWIYRGEDTSEAPDKFYVQTTNGRYGAMWCKRHMAIGERVERAPLVKHHYKDCRFRHEGLHVSGLTLQKRHDSYTFESGIELADVVEMTWDSGERYWFAKGWGLVGFQHPGGRSWISEIHEGRQDLNRNQVKCLPLVNGARFYL